MTALSTDPDEAVRQLREYLTTADLSRCQAKVVTNHFATSETRMNYRLKLAGTTWQTLKNDERGRRLDRLMAQGRASRENGAKALGFSDIGFRRFFKKHTGITIDRYYRQRRAA